MEWGQIYKIGSIRSRVAEYVDKIIFMPLKK